MSHGNGFGRMSVMTRVATSEEAAAMAEDSTEFTPAEEKYEFAAVIGEGGMGQVLLVEDRDLKRQVAMKVMRASMAESEGHRARFVAEAQATSQLEHPGIPPVHDIGIKSTGEIYFTMKLVRGRSLGEVLKDVLLGSREVRRTYTLHRMVSIMERVCEAVHFAHEKGALHRDLKPDNIMLGEYGEVHVVDWGLVKVTGTSGDDFDDLDEMEADAGLVQTESALLTQVGTIKGTVPYMSPEQAGGETLDRRSDVYSLGCILYEMLTLRPAFEGDGLTLLPRVRKGDFPPVRTRNAKRPVPEPLAEVCERAMAHGRDARHETAAAFGEALRGWLDGREEKARRHKEAERLAGEGRAAAERYRQLKRDVIEAEAQAEAEQAKYKPWQSLEEKRSAHEARRRGEQLRADVALAVAETTRLLDAALVAEETNATARAALANLWRERLEEAEAKGNRPDVVHAEAMVRRYDDGRLARFLSGEGTLTLETDPPGAEIVISRFEDRLGVLTPVDERSLGTTPLAPVDLPMGSYLCVLRHEGFRDVRYPVHISRGREWKGTVRMRTEGEIGADFVYVPGGSFVYGEGKETTEKTLDDFAIQKYPVTFAEYGEFLAAVEAEEGVEAAAERLPRDNSGTYMERKEDGKYRVKPDIIDGPAGERCERDHGAGWQTRLPVFSISWHDAVAHCAWKTKMTGREWRLPTEEEREKAARGVDGRRFPWGDAADASLCKNSESRPEPTQPEPVGAFPSAASVYGMLDAAGGVWDWTSSLWEPLREASASRVVRGGGWSNPVGHARAAYRYGIAPVLRSPVFGFRPASSVTS